MKPEDLNPVRKVLDSLHKDIQEKSREFFGPSRYLLRGKNFSCSHCGNQLFRRSKGQTNAKLSSLLGLQFLDQQMTVLICSECGLLFWMSEEPQKTD